MGGKFVRPSSSNGTRPRQEARSISAACAERDRLAMQSTTSFSYCRTYTSTERFAGRTKVKSATKYLARFADRYQAFGPAQQRRQTPSDPQIDAGARIGRIG